MARNLAAIKRDYFAFLDRKARNIAYNLAKGKPVTRNILYCIHNLYRSEKAQDYLIKKGKFDLAYHNPISSDLELFIARILYHYSYNKNLKWSIYLRCQSNNTTPDIRIESKGKTLAIIEIKAKAGWIQTFFSEERYRKEWDTFKEDRNSQHDPREVIRRIKKQLKKYGQAFDLQPEDVFMLLPSMKLVHRKKSGLGIKDYKKWFAKNSKLPPKNLLLLSDNPDLDLSTNHRRKEYRPTKEFENFVWQLK